MGNHRPPSASKGTKSTASLSTEDHEGSSMASCATRSYQVPPPLKKKGSRVLRRSPGEEEGLTIVATCCTGAGHARRSRLP
mmetsp:Transcript_4161/g.10582  ORF Transcript_4161/g.10582 Transcript_4161/m.10582 type:complete len:81 (-) Transcript_4161:516-758(-)